LAFAPDAVVERSRLPLTLGERGATGKRELGRGSGAFGDGLTEQLVEEMKETASEILEKPDSCVRTMTPDCSWCSFQNLCQAELRGQDADFIRKTAFKVDQAKADEEYAEED